MYKEKWVWIDVNNKKYFSQIRYSKNKNQMDYYYELELESFVIPNIKFPERDLSIIKREILPLF